MQLQLPRCMDPVMYHICLACVQSIPERLLLPPRWYEGVGREFVGFLGASSTPGAAHSMPVVSLTTAH